MNDIAARGFFSLQKRLDGWQLIDPQGNPFFSLGVTHVLQLLDQPLFKSLYNSDSERCADDVVERLGGWGFNSFGYGSTNSRCNAFARRWPFFGSVEILRSARWLGHQAAFDDVFDPLWQAQASYAIRRAFEPLCALPNLIGVFWSDLPCWSKRLGSTSIDWVDYHLSLPGSSPGKVALAEFLSKKTPSFPQWKRRVGAPGKSWSEIAGYDCWSPDWIDLGERGEFLGLIAQRYYQFCHSQTRDLLPEALIFGDRYHSDDMPEVVLKEAGRWIDGIAIQPATGIFYDGPRLRRASRLAGNKPVVICDVAVNFSIAGPNGTLWESVSNKFAAAKIFEDYILKARESGVVVGVHRCTYIDILKPDGTLKQGLVDMMGRDQFPGLYPSHGQ